MEPTKAFKDTIQAYLEQRAADDELFAVSYAKEGKNIDDCCTCILNNVQKSGCNGFADEEIYSMAVHYYDEDNIDIGKPVGCSVVVNHVVELTEEEKEEARKKALDKVTEEQIAMLKSKPKKSKPEQEVKVEQASLF